MSYIEDLKTIASNERVHLSKGKYTSYKKKLTKLSNKYEKTYKEVFYDYLNVWFFYE